MGTGEYVTVLCSWRRHPKVRRLSAAARGVWLTGLTASASDGGVVEKAPLVAEFAEAPAERGALAQRRSLNVAIAELVAAGLWEPLDDGTGWQIHDFGDWQEWLERRRERRREAARERQRRHRAQADDVTLVTPDVGSDVTLVTPDVTHVTPAARTAVTPSEKSRLHETDEFSVSEMEARCERDSQPDLKSPDFERDSHACHAPNVNSEHTTRSLTLPSGEPPRDIANLAHISAPAAQQLVGAFVDAVREAGAVPHVRIVGQVARTVRQLLDEGHDVEALTTAVRELARRNETPARLAYIVGDVERVRAGTPIGRAVAAPVRQNRIDAEVDRLLMDFG